MSAHKTWTMPEWMEPFRDEIANTGGNPIEELMNDHESHLFSNLPRAIIVYCVQAQVGLLERAHAKSMLTRAPSREVEKP